MTEIEIIFQQRVDKLHEIVSKEKHHNSLLTQNIMNNLIKYYQTFNKSMRANKALKDFQGGDNAQFTRLQRNATRYHNDCDRIRAEFSSADLEVYNSVKHAWNTYESIFVKGK